MPVTLSPSQIKILLLQVGRSGNAELTELVPELAAERQDKAALGGINLLRLYVKLDLIDILLGDSWEQVDHEEGDESENSSQKLRGLSAMRTDVEAEIKRLEAQASSSSASGGPVAGQLTAQTTVPAPACGPDPSDRLFAGDPLRRHPVPGSEWR